MEDREWVKEFINLYTSSNEENIQIANNLKYYHLPSHLYRYRPVNNLEHIRAELKGKIYLSHQKQLNDPYDSTSILSARNDEEFLNYLYPTENFNTIKECKIDKAPLGSVTKRQILDLHLVFNQLLYLFRIACFTTSNINACMWYNYSENYQGICLEYDTSHFDKFLDFLFPVNYVLELPDIVKIFLSSPSTLSNKIRIMHSCLTSKLLNWQSEEEWRLVISPNKLSEWNENVPLPTSTNGVLIDFIKPSKIILGARISNINKLNILNLATEYEIPVEQLDITQHGLKPKDLRFDFDDLKNDEKYIPQASNLTPSQEKLIDFSTSLPDKDIEKILHYLWFLKEENKTFTEKD